MCLCKKTYYNKVTFTIIFHSGKYYKHLGDREMLGENDKIIRFGRLDSWMDYFEDPMVTRDRKLGEIGII